jgi:predicted DsbA family dithiol-disulfide isomerase
VATASHVTLTVFTDVLCPWCYNGAVRLAALEKELAGALELVWKSYLLRPQPSVRPRDEFRAYTESWLRPAAQPDGGRFRPWATDEPPPSHSIPPQIAVKAAARHGAFDRYHLAVMDAYFYANRNVTNPQTLVDVAVECGLDGIEFAQSLGDDALLKEVIDDHNEAITLGVTGVPAVVAPGGLVIPGAQDRAFYERLVTKLAAR